LSLQGKEVLYADKGCTQQLCKIYNISTEVTKKEKFEDVYVVTVRAKDDKGRYTDEDGAVTIGNLKGDTLANALMKAVTKAKRRAVLAFCGLGMLDETEIETIKGAHTIDINEEPLKMPEPLKIAPAEVLPKEEPSDEKISDEVGFKMLEDLAKAGKTKDDLKAFIKAEFELKKLSEIKVKHMAEINKFIAGA
jgi:hypothetical protein